MSPTYLHLLINHLPIVGTMLALPLLALALFRRAPAGLRLAATIVLVLSAAGAGLALATGERAADALGATRAPEALVEPHEERAEVAAWLSFVTGAGAIAGLFAVSRRPAWARGVTAALLAATAATAGAMAWTAKAGGAIGHPELRGGAAAPAGEPQATPPGEEEPEPES